MRTNIEIDDVLMAEAMKWSGAATKKAVVEEALRMLVQSSAQSEIRKLFGKVKWEGDLKLSRSKDKWADSVQRERSAGSTDRSKRKAA